MTNPCDLSLTDATRQMADGSLSALELMESVLDRMSVIPAEYHPYVVVRDRAELMAEAAESDRARAAKEVGPLQGIPIGIKDIVDVCGLPTKCGSRSMEDCAPAIEDAPLVRGFKAASGIILGKTVTQEFAAGTISAPSRNPWDLDRIPGGSSGGSAAAIVAGMALLTIGTDTGGSIRCPASVCGVTGLKPTYGTVSRRGIYPLAWSLDTAGPIARTVEDSAIALDTISGHDPLDPGSAPVRHRSAAAEIGQDIRGLRIGMPRLFFYDKLEAELSGIFDAAADCLRELGAQIIEADWDLAAEARAVSMVINRAETSAVHDRRVRTHPELVGDEWRLRVKAGLLLPATTYLQAHQARIVVRQSVANYFNQHRLDAMIMPATAGTAARADDPYLTYADGTREHVLSGYTRMTMPTNATGQPSISVPAGFTSAGLPIGMQIVGRPFAEARICRIGHAYEQAARWIDRRPALTQGA
ncbi:MAG TPA: amidase [Thermomicrobiales bacterium]|nr:amidase [Thermomicrobiales bacterium]